MYRRVLKTEAMQCKTKAKIDTISEYRAVLFKRLEAAGAVIVDAAAAVEALLFAAAAEARFDLRVAPHTGRETRAQMHEVRLRRTPDTRTMHPTSSASGRQGRETERIRIRRE